MQTLLFKILNYESEIFEKYTINRQKFIESVGSLQLETFERDSLNNIINDIKDIIEPIKRSNVAINNYFENSPNFQNKDSSISNEELLKLIILHNLITVRNT